MPDHLSDDSQPRIAPEAFGCWEAMILAEQIALYQVPGLLAANPDFATWYCERAVRRRSSDVRPESASAQSQTPCGKRPVRKR